MDDGIPVTTDIAIPMPPQFVKAHMKNVNSAPVSTLDTELKTSGIYDLKKLSQQHKHIIFLHVIEGMKNVEIAMFLGCTAMKVSYTLNSSIARAEITRLEALRDNKRMDVMEYLEELSLAAALEQGDILATSTDPKLRATVARDILDRTVGKRVNAAEQRVDQDMLVRVKQMAEASPFHDNGAVEDAEVIEEINAS